MHFIVTAYQNLVYTTTTVPLSQPFAVLKSLLRNLNSLRHHRLDIKDCLQQILNHIILPFLTRSRDLLHFEFCLFVGILLGFSISACVLSEI
jgi:hypothetical protein